MHTTNNIAKIRFGIKATPRNFLVSHFIDLKNTCRQTVHYPLFIIEFLKVYSQFTGKNVACEKLSFLNANLVLLCNYMLGEKLRPIMNDHA